MRQKVRVATAILISIGTSLFFGQAALAQPLGQFIFFEGEVRLGYLTTGDGVQTTAADFVDLPGQAMLVTIPTGMVADVLILFTGMMNGQQGLWVKALIDNTVAQPGEVLLRWETPAGIATSHGFNFRGTMGAGQHTIRMQWHGHGQQLWMGARSMTVILNLRAA